MKSMKFLVVFVLSTLSLFSTDLHLHVAAASIVSSRNSVFRPRSQTTTSGHTNEKLVDDDGMQVFTQFDQADVVERHIKSSPAKLPSSKLLLEADNVVNLPPAEELETSKEALDTNNSEAAAATKVKKLQDPSEEKPSSQDSKPAGLTDLVDSDANSTGQYQDAESAKIEEAPEAKAVDAEEEVVLPEEKEEDKKLIPDYNLGQPIKDWDRKRRDWASQHPEVKQEDLFIITGTQPSPCPHPEADHFLLRCFKNKVDYSRIHSVGLFYNTALLDPNMPSFWAKLPVVRATMLAHPEVEWIWWLDADAIITDMEFSIPFHRYSAYNLVVHGWESVVFEKRSWLGLNAGSFLMRNCQWSMELMERWASMGPKTPMGDAYYHILSDFMPDRPRSPTDDQSALVFLLLKERQRWAGKLRVELDFFLSGYWLELMDGYEAIEERYRGMEEQHAELWELLEREGAVGKEKLVAAVGKAREEHFKASGTTAQERRAFVTHFTGCQPCTGNHNPIYTAEQCRTGLLRALNYADDQVLRTLGYQHRALHLPEVVPLPSTTARHAA